MLIFVSFISIQIISSLTECESERLHTEFGEYNDRIVKDLWNTDCGLTSVPKKRNFGSNKCFKGKKPFRELMSVSENSMNDRNSSEFNTRILNGQTAGEGEAPWAVLLVYPYSKCGGVVLNKRWILTAGHCIKDHLGTINVGSIYAPKQKKYSMSKLVPHEKYTKENNLNLCQTDIGLVKSEKDIEFTTDGDKYVVNSICLPKMGLNNSREEWATLYGWGADAEHPNNNTEWENKTLLKGEFMLKVNNECQKGCYCSKHISSNSALACAGDSGSGLVQRIGRRNRAVLIGITSFIYQTSKFVRCGDLWAGFVSVPQQIDWVLDHINNN